MNPIILLTHNETIILFSRKGWEITRSENMHSGNITYSIIKRNSLGKTEMSSIVFNEETEELTFLEAKKIIARNTKGIISEDELND
mgnify:CR=1 FL=1